MKLNDRLYEALKWLALIAFPAVAWFYGVLANTWGLPYGDEIVSTLNAIGALIGILIGVSTYQYRKRLSSDNMHEITVEEKHEVDK